MPRTRPNPLLQPANRNAPADLQQRPQARPGQIQVRPGEVVGTAQLRAALTRAADRDPAVVNVQVRELSGRAWVVRFPGSKDTDDLTSPFRENGADFIAALRAAGATATISATLRPPNRAFLMHWSWKIVKQNADPRTVPAREGVSIKWDHPNLDGTYNPQASVAAAQAMVNGYGINNLRVAPSLNSRHIEGNAIDMSISWTGTLTIDNANGRAVTIGTEPRTGMNTSLHIVGATHGVLKYHGGAADKPHWSNDGR